VIKILTWGAETLRLKKVKIDEIIESSKMNKSVNYRLLPTLKAVNPHTPHLVTPIELSDHLLDCRCHFVFFWSGVHLSDLRFDPSPKLFDRIQEG